MGSAAEAVGENSSVRDNHMMYHSYCQCAVCLPPASSPRLRPSLWLWTLKPGSLHHAGLCGCSGIAHFNDAFSPGAVPTRRCAVYFLPQKQCKQCFFVADLPLAHVEYPLLVLTSLTKLSRDKMAAVVPCELHMLVLCIFIWCLIFCLGPV